MNASSDPFVSLEPDAPVAGPSRGPKTLVVLGLLVLAALAFSYLGAYALSGALVSAQFLPAWPPSADPRPRWMLLSFGGLMAVFLAVGATARFLSNRQLRRIDAMAEG